MSEETTINEEPEAKEAKAPEAKPKIAAVLLPNAPQSAKLSGYHSVVAIGKAGEKHKADYLILMAADEKVTPKGKPLVVCPGHVHIAGAISLRSFPDSWDTAIGLALCAAAYSRASDGYEIIGDEKALKPSDLEAIKKGGRLLWPE